MSKMWIQLKISGVNNLKNNHNIKEKIILLFGIFNLLISTLFINDSFEKFMFFFIIFSACFLWERKIVVQILGKPIIKEIIKLHNTKIKLKAEIQNLKIKKNNILELINNYEDTAIWIKKKNEILNQLEVSEKEKKKELIKLEDKKRKIEEITRNAKVIHNAIKSEEITLNILSKENTDLENERKKLLSEIHTLNKKIYPIKEKIKFINGCDFRLIDNFEGFEFEEFCAKLLKFNGYENIIITQKSVDYGIDIIAEKDKVKYAIQCKRYNGKVGNDAIQEAMTGKDYYGCNVAVVLTNSKFTHNAQKLANATGIILWDRDVLRNMIEKNKIKTLT